MDKVVTTTQDERNRSAKANAQQLRLQSQNLIVVAQQLIRLSESMQANLPRRHHPAT